MIEQIVEHFREPVLAIPYIDKYGGLVRVARKSYVNEIGMSYEKTFPVSCNVTEKDCWENGVYKDLIPDEKYRSISYFEHKSKITVSDSELGERCLKYSTNLTFVCWLNLKKMGIDSCSTQSFESSFLKEFSRNFFFDFANRSSVKILSINSKSDNPFSNYSYEDKLGLLLYPFDWYTVDLSVVWHTSPKCFDHPSIYPQIC